MLGPPARSCPAAAAAPAAALARALPARRPRPPRRPPARRPRRRRAPAAAGGDHRRATFAAALLGQPRRRGTRTERLDAARGILGDVAGRGLLEQALYLDTRMFLPDGILHLQRQDVDGRRASSCACPSSTSSSCASSSASPLARACARAPASACTAWRWSGCCRRASPAGPSTASPPPTTTGCAPRWARRSSAATRAGSALAELVEPERRWRRLVDRAPQRARRPQGDPLLPARAVRVARRVRRGARARRRVKRAILYVHSRKASFVAIDREILAERYEVEDLYQPGRVPNPLKVIARRAARRPRVRLVRLLAHVPPDHAGVAAAQAVGAGDRRASTSANMPDIGYGHQQGGLRMHASRWIFRRAQPARSRTRTTRSSEIERNTPIPPRRVTVIHHGVPDPFGELPDEPKERDGAHRRARSTAARSSRRVSCRSCRPLARAAGRALRARRQVARRRRRGAARRRAARTSSSPAGSRTRTCSTPTARAAVYVQASRHEGFGLAVAEAMLAGCVPVVMNVTAMPEVVGDAGVLIDSQEPEEVADGRAARRSSSARTRARGARERILTAFPMERRREGILRVVEEALVADLPDGAGAVCASARREREALLLDLGRARLRAPPPGPARARAAAGEGDRARQGRPRGARARGGAAMRQRDARQRRPDRDCGEPAEPRRQLVLPATAAGAVPARRPSARRAVKRRPCTGRCAAAACCRRDRDRRRAVRLRDRRADERRRRRRGGSGERAAAAIRGARPGQSRPSLERRTSRAPSPSQPRPRRQPAQRPERGACRAWPAGLTRPHGGARDDERRAGRPRRRARGAPPGSRRA